MKKTILYISVFFIIFSGFGIKQTESILFCTDKFSDVVLKAKEHNKMIFIYIGSENCDICERLNKVFSDQQLADYYNEKFVSMKIDPENIRNNMRLTNWGVSKVPTMIYMTKKKKIVYKTDGYKQPHEMLFIADSVIKSLEK